MKEGLELDTASLRQRLHGRMDSAAAAVGVHRNTLSRKVHNRLPIWMEELIRLAAYLEVDPMDLVRQD